MRRPIEMTGRKGAALLLILGILATLGWLAAEIVRETVKQQSESAAFSRAQKLRETAWSATEAVTAALRERKLILGDLFTLPHDGTPLLSNSGYTPSNGVRVTVNISDESGKLAFRKLDADALRELLADVGVPTDEAPKLADILLDRFDPNPSRRLLGMKREDYLAAGLPPPPERPPENFAELLEAPGMAAHFLDTDGKPNAKFRDLCACLSLCGDTVEPNLNTAPEPLLRHLARQGVLTEAPPLLRWRNGPDGVAGTEDDRYARQTADFALSGAAVSGDKTSFTVRRVRITTRVEFGESSFLLCVLADPGAESQGFPWKVLRAEENRRLD
jgi:type II secretory pathway component PulK